MYLGGDRGTGEYAGYYTNFTGSIRDFTMWDDTALVSFPVGYSVLESMLFPIRKSPQKIVVCKDTIFRTAEFEIGSDYYWPSSAVFGTDWYHVRRLAPNTNTNGRGWLYLKDASGNVLSDSLTGNAASSSLSEITA